MVTFRIGLILFLLVPLNLLGQVVNTGVMDTTALNFNGKVTVEGYLDTYYAYDFNKPNSGDRQYFVSMNRHNEFAINLAYIDLKYSSSRIRARIVPGFGTYINANYATEPGSLKNLIEASAGIKIWKDRSIWLDAGVFGSPYTNESAISKDHIAYTRSFAPEYVPYYLSGLKLSATLSPKLNFYLYLINGWQQMADVNDTKSLGTQLEWRPTKYVLLNWNTYVGKDLSAIDQYNGLRVFNDIYYIYSKNRIYSTGCVYFGTQNQATKTAFWWQANLALRYDITPEVSLSGRIEYFSDPNGVQIVSNPGFTTFSSSLGLNYKVTSNMVLRFEGRNFLSKDPVYQRNGPVNNSSLLTTNLTIWY